MSVRRDVKRVSEAPTNPHREGEPRRFDVADLYRGPLAVEESVVAETTLDERLRQAYFWIVNNAIISPHYDIEYNEEPPPAVQFGSANATVRLPTGQCYSSFVLLPLLNFAVRRRCLLVGGPGRGKTASAVLMGLLAGYSLTEVKRAIQHGQPQMTIADLIGNPLPADLVAARSMDGIHIAWRRWLSMRVKIIDEYNRIPTRTQSALLTIMADNYAELLDQIYECPDAAWYLTANDDAGGGTYQVIEALRDRIDVVVKALSFNTRFLKSLLERIEEGYSPEHVVPKEIVFNNDQLEQMDLAIRRVRFPAELRRRFEFFASHFEFFDSGGEQLEYKTKDTVKVSGGDLALLAAADTGRDRIKDLGSQSKNGLSVRALLTALSFVKAMAWFRGNDAVEMEDLRQVLPFVLHDKLVQDPESPFFEAESNSIYRVDRISWIRRLFDLSCAEYDRLNLDRDDPVAAMNAEFEQGLEGLDEKVVRKRLADIERLLRQWAKGRKLYGHVYDDVVKLKYLHQRYTNYLRWLAWRG
ncbi:MAG: AAA family ATPase [Planctomycetales bacterium]|nr:AAA family ATPase [Planctomycetales bacterium]